MATADSIVFRAQYHDESVLIGKSGDDPITLYSHSYAPIMLFDRSMEPHIVILGRADLADTQALLDRWHGGPAAIACNRGQEVL